MSIEELTDDQKLELKQRMLCDHLLGKEDRTPSWGELADVDEYISDGDLMEEFENTEFSEDDFFS